MIELGMKNKIGLETNSIKTHKLSALALEIEHRQWLSKILLLFVFMAAAYSFLTTGLDVNSLFPGANVAFALSFIGMISLVTAWMIYRSNCSWQRFGITTRNWQFALKDSLFYTGLMIIASIGLKWLFMKVSPSHAGPLFNPSSNLTYDGLNISLAPLLGMMFAYIVFCPLQEFIVRGTLQGILQHSLAGSRQTRIWLAILLSNVAFAQAHLHISIGFAIATFLSGLVWGWLYSRHKTLIGVTVSHIIFGVWGQFILGTHFLLH